MHRFSVFFTTALGVLMLFWVIAMSGCATAPEPRANRMVFPQEWELSSNGQAIYHFLEYQDLARSGRTSEALVALQHAISIDPSPSLYLELANFHWRQKNLDETRLALKAGLERFPANREITISLVHFYLTQKRVDSAVTTYQSYLQLNPGDQEARAELGSILIEDQQFAAAVDVLTAVPEAERDRDTSYLLAKANAGLGLRQKAISILKGLLEEHPDFVEAMGELAYLYEMEKNYLAAEEVYTRLSELRGENDQVWLRQISLNLKLNNPDKALSLTFRGPQEENFLLDSATQFLQNGFYSHASRVLERIEEISGPLSEVAFYRALIAYEGSRDKETALEHLRTIPSDDPLYQRALSFRTQILFQLDRSDQALALAREGQQRFPRDKEFWILESTIHESSGDYEQAIQVIRSGLEKLPEHPDLTFQLGFIEHVRGNEGQAMEIMERLISLDPENADALNFVGYTLADEGRDLERARVLIQRAHDIEPDSPHILDSLAWVHYRLDEYDKAWEYIQQTVSMLENDPLIWEHYGDIASAIGMIDEARKGYEKALAHDPENPEQLEIKLDALPAGVLQ